MDKIIHIQKKIKEYDTRARFNAVRDRIKRQGLPGHIKEMTSKSKAKAQELRDIIIRKGKPVISAVRSAAAHLANGVGEMKVSASMAAQNAAHHVALRAHLMKTGGLDMVQKIKTGITVKARKKKKVAPTNTQYSECYG